MQKNWLKKIKMPPPPKKKNSYVTIMDGLQISSERFGNEGTHSKQNQLSNTLSHGLKNVLLFFQ